MVAVRGDPVGRRGPIGKRGGKRQKVYKVGHRAVVRHVGGRETRHAAGLRLDKRDGAALEIGRQQKEVERIHERRYVLLHARKQHAVG